MKTKRFEPLGLAGEPCPLTEGGEITVSRHRAGPSFAYIIPLVALAAALIIQFTGSSIIEHNCDGRDLQSRWSQRRCSSEPYSSCFTMPKLWQSNSANHSARSSSPSPSRSSRFRSSYPSCFTASPNPYLAREAVFSVVMIVCTGLVGTCLTLGALRNYEQDLKQQGHECLFGCPSHACGPHSHSARFHFDCDSGCLLRAATGFRKHSVFAALLRLPVHADGPASPLLHRRQCRASQGNRRIRADRHWRPHFTQSVSLRGFSRS